MIHEWAIQNKVWGRVIREISWHHSDPSPILVSNFTADMGQAAIAQSRLP